MEKQKALRYFNIFLYVFFAVGAIGHFADASKPVMLYMTPFVLLLTGILVLHFSGSLNDQKFLSWFLISFIFTFFLEVAGVRSGLIFGKYFYGEILGLKIYDVPLIIGFNWIFVILGALNTGMILSSNKLIVSFITGILSVIFDLLLEPVAVNLKYWVWDSNTVPFQNYAAWFIISFIISLFFQYFKINLHSRTFIHYFVAQLIFFVILNFN